MTPLAAATLFLACAAHKPAPTDEPLTTVPFTFSAPDAQAVSLVGEMNAWNPKSTPMTRDASGAWQVSVDLAPGQWLYKFWVDGRWEPDPQNPLASDDGHGSRHSWVIVGDGPFRHHDDTPHGGMLDVRIPSKALGVDVEASVYVPPFAQGELPYVVLLHGRDMDRRQWVDNGLVADYVDNLLQKDQIVPFLVVMPSVGPYVGGDKLLDFLAWDLPAYMEREQKAKAGPQWRVLGGFSMGGGLTLATAHKHPGGYGMWFPLAAWVEPDSIPSQGKGLSSSGPIFQYCGLDDDLRSTNRDLATALVKNGARATYKELPGGHGFRFLNAATEEMFVRISTRWKTGF